MLETELAAIRCANDLLRPVVPQEAIRGRRGDGHGGSSGGGFDPGVLRVRFGVLRVAEEIAIEADDSSRLADGPDRDSLCRLKGNLRGPAGTCGVNKSREASRSATKRSLC